MIDWGDSSEANNDNTESMDETSIDEERQSTMKTVDARAEGLAFVRGGKSSNEGESPAVDPESP